MDAVLASCCGTLRFHQLERSGGSLAMEPSEHIAQCGETQFPRQLHVLALV
jgi:hypothetical protein